MIKTFKIDITSLGSVDMGTWEVKFDDFEQRLKRRICGNKNPLVGMHKEYDTINAMEV